MPECTAQERELLDLLKGAGRPLEQIEAYKVSQIDQGLRDELASLWADRIRVCQKCEALEGRIFGDLQLSMKPGSDLWSQINQEARLRAGVTDEGAQT